MAGGVSFHKAATVVDSARVPLFGEASDDEAIASLTHTTTATAAAGDVATVWWSGSAYLVKTYQSGASVPSTGKRFPDGFVSTHAVNPGDVVRVEAA